MTEERTDSGRRSLAVRDRDEQALKDRVKALEDQLGPISKIYHSASLGAKVIMWLAVIGASFAAILTYTHLSNGK